MIFNGFPITEESKTVTEKNTMNDKNTTPPTVKFTQVYWWKKLNILINLGVGVGIKHLGSFLLTSISGEGKFAGEYQ